MLCGHAAPIAELGICDPTVSSGGDKAYLSGNLAVNSSSDDYGALISACTDGMLCVWSRGSGHCRRRRKLPPWVGSPSMVRTLPSNPRYVCIACCFVDHGHLSDHHSVDSVEGSEVPADREAQHKKAPKCTVAIVDTYTLTIVQTVFHGTLSIGSLKFMAVVSSTNDKEKQRMVLADSFGRLQLISIAKNPQNYREGGTDLHKSSSQLEMAAWAENLSEGEQVVSIAICGNVIAFLLKSRCIFRLLDAGTTLGEISFVDIFFHEGDSSQSHAAGGMFLQSVHAEDKLNTEELNEIYEKKFFVWNGKGLSIVYVISYFKDVFKCELLCEIPATSHPIDVRLSTFFTQLNDYILRVESFCLSDEEPLLWKSLVTIWSPCQQGDDFGKLCLKFRMHGAGNSFVDWNRHSTLDDQTKDPREGVNELSSWPCSVPSSKSEDIMQTENNPRDFVNNGRIVSSSMVIAETFFAPYAIVYGFFNGEIELLRFDLLESLASHGGSPHHEVNSLASTQYFSGHTGAILCLAAHRMAGTAQGWSFNQVLVSGSMDCTVRIWDLDTGNIITVLHQHVAPVHQIILPPPRTERPWSDCFLSVGEDSCVALVSFETLQVERMFPGHPNYPAKVVWDGVRGYIACLCRDHSGTTDATDVLYLWDVKTGARERVLRGTASHSMFDNFCKGISMNSISGTVLNENTSLSSLLLPTIEDGSSSHSHLSSLEILAASSNVVPSSRNPITSEAHVNEGHSGKKFPTIPLILKRKKYPIKCFCPYPGIATLNFDLASLMFPYQRHDAMTNGGNKQENGKVKKQGTETSSPHHKTTANGHDVLGTSNDAGKEIDWIRSLEECLLQFSLSFLHLWDVDPELDYLLLTDMKLRKPENFIVASGLQGDKGSLTLTFPKLSSILEVF